VILVQFKKEHIALIGDPFHDRLSLPELARNPHYGLMLEKAGSGYTAFEGGQAVGACGILLLWPGVGQAWAYLGAAAKCHPTIVHRSVRRGLTLLMEQSGLRRVQTEVLTEDDAARAWIKRLGFAFEGHMPGYGVKGESYTRYAIVRK
jgi:hypothetical protein